MTVLFDLLQLHWGPMGLAILCLWLPPFLSRRFRRFLNRTMPSSRLPSTLTVMAVPTNWLDLLRAMAGTYLLTRFAIVPVPDAEGAGLVAVAVRGAIVFVGMVVQTFSVQKKRLVLLGPVFYGTGVAVFLPSLEVGIYAVVVAWIFGLVARMPDVILPCLAFALVACGYVLAGVQPAVLVAFAVVAFPVLTGFMARKRLTFHHRRPPSEAEKIATDPARKEGDEDTARPA